MLLQALDLTTNRLRALDPRLLALAGIAIVFGAIYVSL